MLSAILKVEKQKWLRGNQPESIECINLDIWHPAYV